jgi:hypothetical protein
MSDPTAQRVLEFVRSNSYTYQYLTPYLGSIYIKSSATLEQMIISYRPFLEPNAFTLTQIYPVNMSGLLMPEYWHWLNAASPPPLLPAQ